MQPVWPEPHPPPPPRRSMWLWLAPILLGSFLFICFTAFMVAYKVCGQASAASGVLGTNEIPQRALDKLTEDGVLQPNERVVCYYDVTISGDASEVAFLTTERLVYVKDRRTTALALEDIADVRHRSDSLEGDIIEAQSDAGELLTVTIAPLNDGQKFVHALQVAWKNKRTKR